MSVLKVLVTLIIFYVYISESKDDAYGDSIFLKFQSRAIKTEKSKALIRNVKRELTNLKSSYVDGVTVATICSLIICGALFGGCLICPIWRPRKSYHPQTSDVGNIDLHVIENKFTKNHYHPTNACNPVIDFDGAISRIIKENTLVHNNPCFSMDESSSGLNRSQSLPKVHRKNGEQDHATKDWSQRQKKSKTRTCMGDGVYRNKYFHDNDSSFIGTTENKFKTVVRENKNYNVKSSGRVLVPSRLSVITCSDDYNLFGFYNNTEYLNKNTFIDGALNRGSHGHSRNHKTVFKDLSNCQDTECRQSYGRKENPKLIFSLTNTYECSIDPFPNDINDRFYNMNDVAFKNLFAK